MKDLLLQNCRLDGRYDVRERLGRGSYAEIYVAEDTLASKDSPHKTVVIKALNVFMQNDLDVDLERTLVENFQNEAIALDRVRHPNILSRLGHGTAQDLRGTVFHYLVLEYLEGGDLARYCRQKHLNLFQALTFIEQVCAGLNNAHTNNIIHRDIKPQNLLLTKDHKVVKIADFGVARVSVSDAPVTRVGTNMYAPPEHSPMLSGETQSLVFAELTPAADIYSLAKSVYVLISGESPRFFSNQAITELPHDMRQKPWANDLVQILNKATQNDSRERHQSVNEFWKELSTLKLLADATDGTASTRVTSKLHTIPQPQIAKGFSPNAPIRPKFDTSKNLRLKEAVSGKNLNTVAVMTERKKSSSPAIPAQPIDQNLPVVEQLKQAHELEEISQPKPRRKFLRFLATFIILVGIFAGSLYGTYNYLLGRGISIFGQTSRQMGTVTTNLNLRPEPSVNTNRIGLITRNSRVQIVQKNNNWYEVIITEYGSPKTNPDFSDRGWAYAKYIKIDE